MSRRCGLRLLLCCAFLAWLPPATGTGGFVRFLNSGSGVTPPIKRPFKPFSHHAPAQIKAALQSKVAIPRAASSVPTATLDQPRPQHNAAVMHPNLAKRQLLPPAPKAFLPLKTPSLPPSRPGVPPNSPPPPLAQQPPPDSSLPHTRPTFDGISSKKTAVAFPVSVGTPPNEAARRVTLGLLTIRNAVLMDGLMHTYGLSLRDRHDLGMLLKAPDRPINTSPIKLMHHDGVMPHIAKCQNVVLEPTVFMSNVHPGHSPLRQSTNAWAYIHRGLTQARQMYSAHHSTRPGPGPQHPWNVYLHGQINGENMMTVGGHKSVMSDLRARSQFAHVNFRSLDRLVAKTKGASGVRTCFKEIAWVWNLNTTGLQKKGLACTQGERDVWSTKFRARAVLGVHYVMQAQAENPVASCPKPSVHSSTIVETSPGSFVSAWFGGQAEGFPDSGIFISKLVLKKSVSVNASQWSHPRQVLVPRHGVPLWNPVLFMPNSKDLILFYKIGLTPTTWKGGYIKSRDQGATWSSPVMLPRDVLGPIKNKPIRLADGTLLSPSSVETETKGQIDAALDSNPEKEVWECWVESIVRNGDSHKWERYGPITHASQSGRIIQPALFVDNAGDVRMLARTTSRHVAMAVSKNNGKDWSKAYPIAGLAVPNTGLDAVKLHDGKLLMVHNQLPKPGMAQSVRGVLVLSVSMDDGKTWRKSLTLENSGAQPREYSYPAIIQSMDLSTVHITYTWRRLNIKHVILDASELNV